VNRNVLIPVVLCVVVAACAEKPAPTEAFAPAFSYGTPGCFPGWTATQVCQLFEGPSATATAYCMYGECFEMNYGELVRVVAADERGEYPRTWFAWGDATLEGIGAPGCVLTQERKKTRVEIPADDIRCKARATVGTNTYHEHFASDPTKQCLGWLECKVPVVPAP
jgi:hypothetical protein